MDVFVYLPPHLDVARDEIEDALEAIFQGEAEVTGAGGGGSGSNIDLNVRSMPVDEVLSPIRTALEPLKAVPSRIVVGGRSFPG